jgi:hypothetical protein
MVVGLAHLWNRGFWKSNDHANMVVSLCSPEESRWATVLQQENVFRAYQ